MKSTIFRGCKLALIDGGSLLTYKRDERPDIPYAGLLDLPGGGREASETPEQCVLRELEEEFGLRLAEERLTYKRRYATSDGDSYTYFFSGSIYSSEIDAISFGSEGVFWELISVDEYLKHPQAISVLQARLKDYLVWRNGT